MDTGLPAVQGQGLDEEQETQRALGQLREH